MTTDPYFKDVKRIVDQLDPEGLLEVGAPDDEYATEAGIFSRLIPTDQTISADMVRSIWTERFGPQCVLIKEHLDVVLAEALHHLSRDPGP